ncbi:helix-turn-helix domain-containing protein [Streptomyces lydicus]|uniref:helix-turn-helix domain-containing protein n=1 Tax=Streptomyces lydicus TaxID=47763 RepID=UPI0036FED940
MSRWKALPESLDQRVRQLVVQLRRLKDHSGLSLVSLAARTSYSKSSWERYLNGKKLPPREAVAALARVCGADPTRLLALHEVAAQAWRADRPAPAPHGAEPAGGAGPAPETARAAGPPDPDDPADPADTPDTGGGAGTGGGADAAGAGEGGRRPAGGPRARTGPLVVLAALGVVVVAAVALLIVRPWQQDGAGRGTADTAAGRTAGAVTAFTHRVGETFDCHLTRTPGGLSAGRSRTTTAILGSGATGWDVVEAQCLLHHHGYDPGPVDGIVGEHTQRAVKRLQAGAGLPTDGIVGPDTWKVLRR